MRKTEKPNRNRKRSRFAQNKIDYIVYGNPTGAKKLILSQGYEAPQNLQDLLLATKELLKRKGKALVPQLVKIHPDKQLILKYHEPLLKEKEDHFCGACGHSNFNGTPNFEDKIKALDKTTLEGIYRDTLTRSNQNPADQKLAQEVEVLWNTLTKKKNEPGPKEEKKDATGLKSDLAIAGILLVAGILIGSSIKNRLQHG